MGTYRNRGNYRDSGYRGQDDMRDREEYGRESSYSSRSGYGNDGGRSYVNRPLSEDRSRGRGYSGMYPDSRSQDEGYFGGGQSGPSFGGGYVDSGIFDQGMSDSYGGGDSSDRWSGNYGGSGYGGRHSGSSGGGDHSYDRGYAGRSDYPTSERGYRPNDRSRGRDERGWWDKTSDEVASWFGDEEAERRRERDHSRGEHRGRGPKNYTRSDDRIKEDVNDRLTYHSFLDASDIEVDVNDGEVTLTGNVDSRYAKRMAEDIAEDVSGVRNVENRVRYNSGMSSRSNRNFDSDDMDTSASSTSRMTTGTTGTTGAKSKAASSNR